MNDLKHDHFEESSECLSLMIVDPSFGWAIFQITYFFLFYLSCHNPLTPKPAVTGQATFILVWRIPVCYCSECGEKAVGRVGLGVEIRDEAPSIDIFSHL
ncbi:hypothetical protein AVEN_71162-1 [Araneus ventricosus]|uniref:Uncharacterized protein n=1 Tax=Araneus ventricosus TaxID=182803 RepID=A0A4Y2MWE0_ARAVE|nr:hypothetical protein AVEN_71162-1 [Araneus ventricosus]